MTFILMALKPESKGLVEDASRVYGIPVFYTGIGLLAAAYQTTALIGAHKPTKVINLGTAGSRKFAAGSLVQVTEFHNRSALLDATLKFKIGVDPFGDLPRASCGSADYLDVSDNVEKFDVLDMEAYAIAYVCKKMGVPFQCVKYITDRSDPRAREDWRAGSDQAAISLSEYIKTHLEGHLKD